MSHAERLATLMHEPSTDAGDDVNRLRRVELSRDEMLRQGAAIQTTLDSERARFGAIAELVKSHGLRRVVIVGCGDSLGIGIACRMAFEAVLRVPTEAVQALDYALYASHVADRETLVIGISASGKTEAVMAALANARARGAVTLGLSNTPTSSLATEFAASLTVHATRKGWPTQSSTAAIALLCGLAATLAEALGTADAMAIRQLRADLADLPMLVDAVTSAFDAPAQALAETFAAAAIILFAGAGAHQAAAFFGAAKIKELSPIHAVSMPLEEYHHYRTQKAGDLLFLVAPDGASHARALDTALVGRARGGRTVALLPKGETEIAGVVETPLFLPAVRPELASIIYSVPLHLFAYHFAKARFARKLGYPGAFPATAA